MPISDKLKFGIVLLFLKNIETSTNSRRIQKRQKSFFHLFPSYFCFEPET